MQHSPTSSNRECDIIQHPRFRIHVSPGLKGVLHVSEIKRISILDPIYGTEVDLIGESGETEPFRIIAEFQLGERSYAGLQSHSMQKEDEIAFFRIVLNQGSEPELESIEDDEEWEDVAEAYDDLMFEGDEQP
ncbi:DUF1292 domain-containing protein [Paenibacillus sacheonensis]|uniref:DUF1292 domain-containing protein n=1 Tax=Paenibacillus sacheonensis TaxID=742054 RepID=A0A7X4YK83_9BACL|nr:DUF1292 domain-containing protein [Paenibacillus sacheonensis]